MALSEKLLLLLVGENKMRKNWKQIFKKRKVESGCEIILGWLKKKKHWLYYFVFKTYMWGINLVAMKLILADQSMYVKLSVG